MTKKKGVSSIKHGQVTITWNGALGIVAKEFGYVPNTIKANRLAALASEKFAIPYGSAQDVIFRAAVILVDRGNPVPARSGVQGRKRGYKKPKGLFAIGSAHPDYKRGGDFYKSRAWRELRLLVLDNVRGCQACGARPPDVVLHVDHVLPRYTHPHLELCISNLQCLCEDCNVGKGAWSQADFRNHFKSI